MQSRHLCALALVAGTAGCSGSPVDDPPYSRFGPDGELLAALLSSDDEPGDEPGGEDGDGGGEEPADPNLRTAGDVASVSYDPAAGILTVGGDPFDLDGALSPVPDDDVNGFAAFANAQGERSYLMLFRANAAGSLAAGAIGTPRKYDNEFGGTVLARGEVPELPLSGEIVHVGRYAAVRNVGANDGGDMSNSHLYRVAGDVRLALDFFADSGNVVEGVITDRRNLDTFAEYGDIVLRLADIDAEASFQGEAAVTGAVVGTYDGMIAGDDAGASAGVVVIREGDDLERGAFIAEAE